MLEDIFIRPGPEGFRDETLDRYLAAGFYRMREDIFTTHSIYKERADGELFIEAVFWLRSEIARMSTPDTVKKIRRKCRHFNVRISPLLITEEMEILYVRYLLHIDFFIASSISENILSDDGPNPFDTWMVEVRDGNRLIAAGLFDKGKESIQGLVNFYDPEYSKYSLSKYMMIALVDHGRETGMRYFYPGYIYAVDGKMDYKLFTGLDGMEIYMPVEKEWHEYRRYDKDALLAYAKKHLTGKKRIP
jgi:arginine-tRNA-protein transferase